MRHSDFSDGPFCEDFDEPEHPKYLPCSLVLWRERAAQQTAKTSAGKQDTRSDPG